MASIEPLKGGYRIVWREGGRGSRQQYLSGIKTKAQALAEKARIEGELRAAMPLRRRSLLSLDEILQRWKLSRQGGPRPNDEHTTDKSVARAAFHFRYMGWKTTADITPAEVERWRGRIKRTLRAGAVIRAILWWAKDFAEQPVADSTLAALRPPVEEGRPPRDMPAVATVVKAQRAAEAMSESAGALIHCLSFYGWRPITCARADVRDLRADGLVLHTKGRRGSRDQLVPLMPATRKALERLCKGRAPDAPLFTDPRSGERWAPHGPASIPEWSRRLLGLHVYDLKYFAVTNLLDVLEPHRARDLTTHKTLSQLYRYARGNRQRGKETIGLLLGALKHAETPTPNKARHGKGKSAKRPQKAAS